MQFQWNGHLIMDEIHVRLRNDMLDRAQKTVASAQMLAPKKTTRLAQSIGFDWNDADLSVTFTVGVEYGIFQEYGTRNMMPHPYLRPAINAHWSQLFGYNTEMAFLNTPVYNKPLMATGGTFRLPKGVLTQKQKQHITNHLIPRSQMHYVGAVSRTRMHARRQVF